MKLLLILALLTTPHLARADEGSAESARSSENSPVIPAAEGEGELSLDTESPARRIKTVPGTKQLNALCKADSNPEVCKENTKADLKKMAAKKKKSKEKIVSPPGETP